MMKNIFKFWEKEFWPIKLFRDCSIGSSLQRLHAYNSNKENVNLLVNPILNWILLIAISFSFINLFEQTAKNGMYFLIYLAAIFGIVTAWSVIGFIILSISFVMLKFRNECKF